METKINNLQISFEAKTDHLQASVNALTSLITQMATTQQATSTPPKTVTPLNKRWGTNDQPGQQEVLKQNSSNRANPQTLAFPVMDEATRISEVEASTAAFARVMAEEQQNNMIHVDGSGRP